MSDEGNKVHSGAMGQENGTAQSGITNTEAPPANRQKRRGSALGKAGAVYFAETEDGLHIKIGFSARPNLRLMELRPIAKKAFGVAIRLIGVMPGTNMRTEHWLHDIFREHKEISEWYKAKPVRAAMRGLLPAMKVVNHSTDMKKLTGKKTRVRDVNQATDDQKIMSQAMAMAGRKGGPARAAALTQAELSAIGKKGAEARWGKRRRRKDAKPVPPAA